MRGEIREGEIERDRERKKDEKKYKVDKIFTLKPKLEASDTKMKYYNQDDGTLSCLSVEEEKDSRIETSDRRDIKCF